MARAPEERRCRVHLHARQRLRVRAGRHVIDNTMNDTRPGQVIYDDILKRLYSGELKEGDRLPPG